MPDSTEDHMSGYAGNPDCGQGQYEPFRAVKGAVVCIETMIDKVFVQISHDENAGTPCASHFYDEPLVSNAKAAGSQEVRQCAQARSPGISSPMGEG